MNGKLKKLNFLIILVVVAVFLSSCGNDKENPNRYENEELQFSVVLPSRWKDKYDVKVDKNSADFFVGEGEQKSIIFRIKRYNGIQVEQEDLDRMEGNEKVLLKEFDVTYTSSYNYRIEEADKGGEPSAKIQDYVSDVKGILNSFETTLKGPVLGVNKSSKENYLGTTHFELIIPNYFRVERNKTDLMTWDLKLKDSVVGKISMIPYGTGEADSMDEDKYIGYKKDSSLKRELRVAMLAKYIEGYNFQIAKDSVKFLTGPTNIIDIMTQIKENTGTKAEPLFGKITDVKMSGGKVAAIDFQRIYYDENEKNNSTVAEGNYTYTVSPDAKVVPFAAPNYDVYGDYLFYNNSAEYFSSEDFNNYEAKTFYINLNSGGEVIGVVAEKPYDGEKDKEL